MNGTELALAGAESGALPAAEARTSVAYRFAQVAAMAFLNRHCIDRTTRRVSTS